MENIDDPHKKLIKSELSKRGLKVKDLIVKLKHYWEDLTELYFNNKMSRGGFSAVFFLKRMKALEVKNLNLEI